MVENASTGSPFTSRSSLHQFRRAITGVLVIHRAVTAGDAFDLVVEIDQDFVQRQLAVQHDAAGVERLGVIHRPAFLQDELEDVADGFVRAKNVGAHDRLADFLDHARVGQVRRVIDQHGFAARGQDFVNDAREVAMMSMSYSRRSRSWMISMWSSPRKPQRKPKPSATELSG